MKVRMFLSALAGALAVIDGRIFPEPFGTAPTISEAALAEEHARLAAEGEAPACWSWLGQQHQLRIQGVQRLTIDHHAVAGLSGWRLLIDLAPQAELDLAMQLIDQIAEESYDPHAFKDEEKQRILAAIDRKIAGQQIVAHEEVESPASGQVIDLMEALTKSLKHKGAAGRRKAGRRIDPDQEDGRQHSIWRN